MLDRAAAERARRAALSARAAKLRAQLPPKLHPELQRASGWPLPDPARPIYRATRGTRPWRQQPGAAAISKAESPGNAGAADASAHLSSARGGAQAEGGDPRHWRRHPRA